MSRTTTIPTGTPGGHKANGSTGAFSGHTSGPGGGFPGKQPLAHIDDVKSVTIDFDPFTPMDKLLSSAETLLNEAETYKNFGRIDFALMSYIRAQVLLLDVIKKNKGWVSLQADNKGQKEKYTRLLRKAAAAQAVFEQIKSDITADNVRSGVQPKNHGEEPVEAPSTGNFVATKDSRSSLDDAINSDRIATPTASPTPPRTKPAVRPKPESLHGNSLQPVGGAKRAAEDLTARFAKLRAANSASAQPGVQDPRIKTQPIVPQPASTQSPIGRRNAVVAIPRPSLTLDSGTFALPKVPDAIYKPARGTVSNEAAELPSSTSGRFSLARSLTNTSLNSPGIKSPLTGPGLTVEHTSDMESSDGVKRTKLTIPDGETISVTDLVTFMKAGSKAVSILLIDIRSREEFDEGHIMSQATICIEPEVLMRNGISASEIAETMVLAPGAEQVNFDKRHEFDLIVFYDRNSTRIGWKKDNQAVQGLYNALVHFDFDGENTARPPKLLEGGLEAWTSVMGDNSLATTGSSVARPSRRLEKTRPSLYPSGPRKTQMPEYIRNPEEARRWEETLKEPDAFTPITDVDGFLRRFPSVSATKESMASPEGLNRTGDGAYSSLSPSDSLPDLPSEPKRPQPTAARPSYSGLKEREEPEEMQRPGRLRPRRDKKTRNLVGLRNPNGAWCYANVTLQSLFWTPDFADELITGSWQKDYVIRAKHDETIPNPQLMIKMLSQLFQWMDKATIDPLEARTLQNYVKHIHRKDSLGRPTPKEMLLGGPNQQDAQEYLNSILDNLHEETNIHRHKGDSGLQSSLGTDEPRKNLHVAIRYWLNYTSYNSSIITKYWRALYTSLVTCTKPGCGYQTLNFSASDIIFCRIVPGMSTLEQMLAKDTSVEPIERNCERCGSKDATTRVRYARLPDRLQVQIGRHASDGREAKKLRQTVRFPIRGLDMEPYHIPPEERFIDESDAKVAEAARDRGFRAPFIYDCYAVICHIGEQIRSGHYVCYVRDQRSDDATDWIKFNDTRYNEIKVGTNDARDRTEEIYAVQKDNQQAYLVLYQRRGA